MDFHGAARRVVRTAGVSTADRASSVSRGRAAFVLLGWVLLCGASAVHEFEISIRDRRVEGTATTLRVKRGESVLLRWHTDEAVSVHVHGYEVRANLSAGSPGSMSFEAGVAGRFPITVHAFGTDAGREARPRRHREVTLLYLEVLPE